MGSLSAELLKYWLDPGDTLMSLISLFSMRVDRFVHRAQAGLLGKRSLAWTRLLGA